MATQAQKREVDQQVDRMFARSRAFHSLDPQQQAEIRRNTTSIVQTLADNGVAQAKPRSRTPVADPYAVGQNIDDLINDARNRAGQGGGGGASGPRQMPNFTGGAQPGGVDEYFGPKNAGDFGTGIATGVSQAGALLRQVNFPAFVAELIQGVFQAVVDASIQQMQAYGELVQGVVMSLNDFRDANVTENQGRDHLVKKFPKIFQINVGDVGPQVGLRDDADTDELPDIAGQLGLPDEVTDLDEDTIESQLVPAARDDLARSRQTLLATMLLMGINRIVVTDGKINAKLKFKFKAKDTMNIDATTFDYDQKGTIVAVQSEHESGSETGENYKEKRSSGWLGRGSDRSGESSRWSSGSYQRTEVPNIVLEGVTETSSSAELEASAKLSGEVSLNFKSETVDLNQLASGADMFKLERVRDRNGAGRGAPPPATPPATATPPPGTAPPAGGVDNQQNAVTP